LKISFLLFDEIEKASDALWQLLLGMLDKATLTLGDNRRVDLSQAMIFMTSNLGGSEISELMTGGMGFAAAMTLGEKPRLDEKVERMASEAAKRKFAPEFINRIDKTVVFRPYAGAVGTNFGDRTYIGAAAPIGDAEGHFVFRATRAAKDFLLREGTDLKYGARHLKRTIERHLVCPLASLLATDQVTTGETISVTGMG